MAKRFVLIALVSFLAIGLNALHYGTSYWNFDPPDMLGFPPGYIWDTATVTPGQWGEGNYYSEDYSVKFEGRTGYIISRAFDFDAGDTADISGWIVNGGTGTVDYSLAYSTSQSGPWTQFYTTGNINGQADGAFYTAENFSPPAPGTYYFRFSIVDNGSHTLGYLDDISLTYNEGIVPVELSSFMATLSDDNFVKLMWVTQSETGVLGFYILRNSEEDLASALTVSGLFTATNTSQQQTYAYTDTELFEDGTYFYWLQANELDGSTNFYGPVSVYYDAQGDNPTPEIPLVTELKAVYPNPFNPLTFIPFSLAQDSKVDLRIYNTRGQIVKHYDLGSKAAGNYRVSWNGTDYNGQTLANGVYRIEMTAGKDIYQTKAVLLK